MSRDQFIAFEQRRTKRLEEAEAAEVPSEGHKQYVERRWAVRLWNLQLESLIKEECMVFLNINWGGSREEARIRTGEGVHWWQCMSDSEVVWGTGSEPRCLRSSVLPLKEKAKLVFPNEYRFEWRGSYSELESDNMVIELWRWNKFRANTIDAVYKQPLVACATGPVFQEVQLVRANIAQVNGIVINDAEELPRFRVAFQLYFQEIYDFELNIVDVQASGLIREADLTNQKSLDYSRSGKTSLTALNDDGHTVFNPSDSSDSDASDDETTLRRRRSARPLSPTALSRAGSHFGESPSSKKTATTKLKRRAVLKIENPSIGFKLRRGAMVVRSSLSRVDKGQSSADRWGNIGRILYRGTFADLDNDLLQVEFFESGSINPVPTLIARASVSLRGVYEFGTVLGPCSVPEWAVAAARSRLGPESVKQVMKANAGSFEAKVTVENLPKYKQTGELCDMVASKAYLLVKVLRVDRVAIPDQRPISQCDSAVQVQFSGNSYETEVRQDTISPQFNQEFYFELKTDAPTEFAPAELAQMHGPVIFDVWLRSDDEGALTAEHCGHVEVSLAEIFADGKPETKTHTSIRTGEETEYRTSVLKARKRLTCLWTDAGPNVNVPVTAAIPSFLYVDIWLRPFDFSASTPAAKAARSAADGRAEASLPQTVRREWNARLDIWDSKADELQRKYWTAATNRSFPSTAKSQNRDEHFLPTFLDVIRPPEVLANPKAIAFWVHCLPHTSMEELHAAVPFWATPDFTISLGKGDTFAHAILHCSMLRGLPGVKPFVCIGTGWDAEPIAWVMTMHADGTVKFFDTAGHRVFELPRRVADTHRAKRAVRGGRPPGQFMSDELQTLEMQRRQRLIGQELRFQKMNKFELDTIDCDPGLFRAPEVLKLVDPDSHRHALVYSSDINRDGLCMRCGARPAARCLHGFVCNKRMAANAVGGDDSACLTDDCQFLCLRCASRAFPEGTVVGEAPEEYDGGPMKFAEQPILPYKTIDVVFDNTNCWMNVQHFCPNSIFFDLWNPLYWHPFTTVLTSFRSFSLASKGLRKARAAEYYANIRMRILTKLKKSIESVRRNGNLTTFFQNDDLLVNHVERGLELGFRAELVESVAANGFVSPEWAKIDSDLTEWKLEFYSKVPAKHRFVGFTFMFSFTDASEIARIILDRIDFIALNTLGTQFVIAAYTGKLPNSVKAAYVYVGHASPLSDAAALEVTEIRTNDSFQTSGATTAFTDEVIERNKLFVQRMQTFESDTEFISRMRAELYNKENRSGNSLAANIVLKQSAQTRAPFNAENLVKSSTLDFAKDFPMPAARAPPQMPPIMESEAAVGQGAWGTNFKSTIGGFFNAAKPSGEEQEPLISGNLFGNIFAATKAAEDEEEVADTGSQEVPEKNQLLPKRSRAVKPKNLTTPTAAELAEIYRPIRVERVVGTHQVITHLPTGYSIPIPPQAPLREAVALGGESLTTHVHVSATQAGKVTKVVPPPKDVLDQFRHQSPQKRS